VNWTDPNAWANLFTALATLVAALSALGWRREKRRRVRAESLIPPADKERDG
jgi:hypothetical protein